MLFISLKLYNICNIEYEIPSRVVVDWVHYLMDMKLYFTIYFFSIFMKHILLYGTYSEYITVNKINYKNEIPGGVDASTFAS